jgi:hypothetical protein
MLRVNILANSEQEAMPELEAIKKFLSNSYKVYFTSEIEQYWKMREYFQVWVEFETNSMSEAQFLNMLASLGSDWYTYSSDESERWAVWNKKDGDFISNSKVGWACITEITGLPAAK